MFIGTIPQGCRNVLAELIKKEKPGKVFCACSGNFTSDKIMSQLGWEVHSNDVSLYTKLLADLIMGTDTTPLRCTDDEYADVFNSWPDEDPFKKIIMVMYVMKTGGMMAQKNEYQRQKREVFLSPDMALKYYETTKAKLQKGLDGIRIKDFYFGDFVAFLKENSEKGLSLAFPPTYKGGYEKIYTEVENRFDYERAKYELYDPKKEHDFYGDLMEQGKCFFYFDKEIQKLSPYLKAKVNPGGGKLSVYLYSNLGEAERTYYISDPAKPIKKPFGQIDPEFKFTKDTKIEVVVCKTQDVNYYKSFYMAARVKYTNGGSWGLAFLADGLAFGFASYSDMQSTLEELYALSDFVVASHVPKLSKLLIMLELTKEVRHIAARKTGVWYEQIKTTVYTEKPVSMKYRGAFKLTKREKGKLIYNGTFTDKTIQETYDEWWKKFNK